MRCDSVLFRRADALRCDVMGLGSTEHWPAYTVPGMRMLNAWARVRLFRNLGKPTALDDVRGVLDACSNPG